MKTNKEYEITTIIGRGAKCGGDFSAKGSARIDGRIDGGVTVEGTLTVGASGHIDGNVKARSVVVGGEIIGDVNVSDKVELTATARVIGNITTSLIVIDEKAIFQGTCNMQQDAAGKRPHVPSKALKAESREARETVSEVLKGVREGELAESVAKESGTKEGDSAQP